MGRIVSIVYQPLATDVSEKRFNRIPINEAQLIAGYGIEGDRKAGRNPKRHLNIMMRETLDGLVDCGFQTAPGEMGEQIQIQGIDIENMESGTLLKLGDTAIVCLNKPRTGCVWLEHIQAKPCEDTEGKLGIMASVIESGRIRLGDTVTLLEIPEKLETV